MDGGSPFVLSKVHSRPVEGDGIELERIGSLKAVILNPMLQQAKDQAEKEDRDQQSTPMTRNYGTGNRNGGDDNDNGVDDTGTTSVDVDVDLDVDESLFDTQGKVAMTRAPYMKPAPPSIPLCHMSTSPAALPSGPKPVTGTFLPSIPSFKPKVPTAPRSLLPPSYDSAAPKSSASTVSKNQNTNSQSESGQEIDNEPGVIWVRSFSSKRGGSVFVGKDAAPRSGMNADEDGSLMSADSQELYALRKLHGFQDIPKTKSTVSRGTAMNKDNDVSSVVSRGTEVSRGTVGSRGTATSDASKSIRASQTKSIMASRSKHLMPSTIAEDSDEGSEDVFDKSTTGTVFTSDQTALDEELESSESDESDDSDDEMTMDTYANFTLGDEEDDSEDSSDDDDDDDDDDEFSDDGTADTEALALGISSVAGGKSQRTVKTTVSDVSGSFDDDEVLGKGDGVAKDVIQEPIELEREIQKKIKAERDAKKKQVFKMGTGLGKKKGEMKTVKIEAKKMKVSKRENLERKKVKKTKMKTSGVRVPKKKVIKKKRGVQLRTIRINGQLDQDDIVPRKGDPGVKVMRVCKLTSHGYVAAEFTSIDPLNTPLHIACLTHYPTRFILEHLLKSDVDKAIATENSSGELPIHYAVMDKKGVDPEVFEAMIKKFPESVEHKNIDDSLPIHVACQVGAPSLYSVKRLLEINPDSVLVQNDLQVPLDNDGEEEDEQYQRGCHEMLCFDWKKEEVNKLVKYETGWTPLHLAAVNGAPPDVIEAIIEANIECMNVKTNKKRTPMECAKNVVINAVLNDVEIYKVQNTLDAIEVMQSYEKEIRVKQELALKGGIVNSTLENSESYGDWWMGVAKVLPTRETLDEMLNRDKGARFDDGEYDYGDADWSDEKGMTNLHRAVLKKAEPDMIHKLMEDNPECLDIVSTMDRTPFECAKMVIIRGLLNKDPISTLTNTFVTLEIMQAYRENSEGSETAALSRANINKLQTRNRLCWGSNADAYEYVKKFVAMNLSGGSLLGKVVTADTDSAIQPFEYFPPANLRHVNLRTNVPVGYRRLRKALLNERGDFLKIAVHAERLHNRKIKITTWNKHGKAIGQTKLKKGEKWSDYKGAKRTDSYMVPKSEIGMAHMVYETVELIEYNDYCFAVKSIIKNPDLSFGSEYETHCQTIVIDKGINNSRIICSSEMVVTGMVMDDDWQVRNSMRHRATAYFYALGDAICMHAGSDTVMEKILNNMLY